MAKRDLGPWVNFLIFSHGLSQERILQDRMLLDFPEFCRGHAFCNGIWRENIEFKFCPRAKLEVILGHSQPTDIR